MQTESQRAALRPFRRGDDSRRGHGRTPSKWLRDYLDAAQDHSDEGKTRRQKIAEHLYEVATSWQILHFGKALEVASGRDSVAAAQLLFSYDMGPPAKADMLGLAEHFRRVERDRVDVALAILGPRITALSPEKLADFFRSCAVNPLGFVEAAQVFLREGEATESAALPAADQSPPTEDPPK